MTPLRVVASSAAELIGIIPSLLGFVPSHSILLVGMLPDSDGERVLHRAGPLAMVTLDVEDASDLASEELWRSAVAPLLREGADGLFVVAYAEEADGAALAVAVAGLSEAMMGTGVPLTEAVCVRDGRISPLLEDDAAQGDGVAVPAGAQLPQLAPFVAAGVAPMDSLDELTATYRAGSADAARVSEVEIACRTWEGRERNRKRASGLAALGMLLGPEAPPVGEFPIDILGAAIGGLSDAIVRDVLASWLVPSLAQAFNEGSDEELFREVLVKLLGEGVPATAEDAHRVQDRLRAVLTFCPAARADDLSGVLGLFLWSIGDGVMARRVWEAAPSSGFARLGLVALSAGVGPGLLFGSSVR